MEKKKKRKRQRGRREKFLKFVEGRERRVGLLLKKDFLFSFFLKKKQCHMSHSKWSKRRSCVLVSRDGPMFIGPQKKAACF